MLSIKAPDSFSPRNKDPTQGAGGRFRPIPNEAALEAVQVVGEAPAEAAPVGGDGESSVDVRVVTASHRDLARGTTSGWFRADLYYRIAVVPLQVPLLPRLFVQLTSVTA